MASRMEKCNWCGVQLLVPSGAQTVRCAVCNSIVTFRPDPLAQAQNSLSQAARRFKGLVNTVSDNINSLATSFNTHPPGTGNSNYAHHSQYPPPPPLPLLPPPTHGRKRALLCGVTYKGKSYMLKGSVNDVKCIKYFLIEKMAFPSDSILILSEDEPDPFRIPTRYNILMAMRWLVYGCQSGDSLVFHFSGHGSKQRDFDMDEIDGYDESICPVDHEIVGKILDDEINATIVGPLPHGVRLHAIIDACYSGTVLDLPYMCRMDRQGSYRWEDHRLPSAAYKGTSGGIAICISACDDHQTSADTTAFSGYTSTGAMTYSFIQAVQNEPGLTYGRLLNAMRNAIREAKSGIRLNGPIASLLSKVLGMRLSQEPQLSASQVFDIYSTKFVL